MVFRASNIVPQAAYQTVKSAAVQLKLNLQGAVSRMASQNTDYEYLRGLYQVLKRADDQFTSLKTTPGLAAFAQAQESDPAYNVVAEFTTMQDAISGVTAWMATNLPLSVTLRPVTEWGSSGSLIATEYTPAQTLQLRNRLDTVIASIA
jgi:hypothetical protein